MKLSLFLKTARCTFFIYLFLYQPIFAQTSKIDSSEMVTLRIDPETARGTAVSAIFDEVNFIPLESTKESLFGAIDKLEITDECFVVSDSDTRAVLIFSKTGKFRAKISGAQLPKDKGENERPVFYGFRLKKENNEVFIVILSKKYAFIYDLNGKLVKKVLDKDAEVEERKFADQTIIHRAYEIKKGKDTLYYEISLSKENKEVANYFPYTSDKYKNDQIFIHGNSFYDYGVENELFNIQGYDYNIYKIKPTKMLLAYHLIFPANNSLPADFLPNPIYKNKRSEYFDKHKRTIYALSNTYLIGNNLFLKTADFNPDAGKKNDLIYQLKTNALISLADLEPDSLASFLPITDLGFSHEFANKGFHLYHQQYFYTSYSSLAMFAFKAQSEGKNAKYTALLSEYFKIQNRKSNPVIIQLKPKKD